MEVKGIVHCKREPFDVYIGRPSQWGNPFLITQEASRNDVIMQYAYWVVKQPKLMAALSELDGKVLGCWCKPHACHGDILAELLKAVTEYPDHHPGTAYANYLAGREVWDTNGDVW